MRIYRVEGGGLTEVAQYDRSDLDQALMTVLAVEWNPQGTHLLISVGFGL